MRIHYDYQMKLKKESKLTTHIDVIYLAGSTNAINNATDYHFYHSKPKHMND